MKPLSALFALLLLSACGTTSTTRLNVVPVERTSFTFSDERPFTQRLGGKVLRPYGEETNLADDEITPPPVKLFQTWLQRELAKPLAGTAVSLQLFTVEVLDPAVTIDEQRFSNAANSTPGANPLSAGLARLLVRGIESARSSKTVDVRIGAAINGKEVSARGNGHFKGRVTEDDISSVIRQALDAFVKEAKANLSDGKGVSK